MQLDREQFLKLEKTLKENSEVVSAKSGEVLIIHYPDNANRDMQMYVEELGSSLATQFDITSIMLPESVNLSFKDRAEAIKELKSVIQTLEDPES